ncbi:MAG: TetR/AcrR family transcriptional regulator C-terminal domain-containing protein [Miltoncostaeaceae bacterium]
MGSRSPLTTDLIMDAALGLIDRAGLPACTMRAVARELDVQAMSLYWHVRDKDALLDGVILHVLREIAEPPARQHDWPDDIRAFARRFRRVILAHPNVAPLIAQRPTSAYVAAKRAAVTALGNLERAGFDRGEAVDVARAAVRFVFGFAITEAGRDPARDERFAGDGEMGALARAVAGDDPERLFEFGLDVLIDGISARLAPAG